MSSSALDRRRRAWRAGLLAGILLAAWPGGAAAQTAPEAGVGRTEGGERPSVEAIVAAVVGVKAFINPDGRTVATLGREREGTGVLIASDGLILTIGYLMVEALEVQVTDNDGRTHAAKVVGYDFDTGFGLLRTLRPLAARPLAIGRSADAKVGERVLVAGAGGLGMLGAAHVVARREFAGYWEYMLDEAIFTTPPHPGWGGAALIGRDGRLLGIGSLIVGDAMGSGGSVPGNMFVPIDLLAPILGEILAHGRVSGPARPWLGITTDELAGRLVVRRVTPGGPAEKAGVQGGDVIQGVGERSPRTLAEFYRAIWARGAAGVAVPLEVRRDGSARRLEVPSADRRSHLKLDQSF